MKTKINISIAAIALVAIGTVLWLESCRKAVEPLPVEIEREPEHMIIGHVLSFDSTEVFLISKISVTSPDSSYSFTLTGTNVFYIEEIINGKYNITVEKEGYSESNQVINVELDCDSCVIIFEKRFFLKKLNNPVTVTVNGGTFYFDSTIIVIPPGTFSNTTKFSLTEIPSTIEFGEFNPIMDYFPVNSYYFDIEDHIINNDIEFTFPINDIPSISQGDSLILFGYYNTETNSWELIKAEIDSTKTMATVKIPHFSIWNVITGYKCITGAWTWSSYSGILAISSCGESVSATYTTTASIGAQIAYIIGVSVGFSFSISGTGNCGAQANKERSIRAKYHKQNYTLYKFIGIWPFGKWFYVTTFTIPKTPIKFDCISKDCHDHDQGGGK